MLENPYLIHENKIDSMHVRDDMLSMLLFAIRANVNSLNQKYKSALYEPNDFVQEVWLKLVSNDGHLLKQYDAARGKSMNSYIKMITEREMVSILRKENAEKRGRYLTVELSDTDTELPYPIPFDTKLEARNLVQNLYFWLCDRLSDLGIAVLHAIYFSGDDAADAASHLGLSTQAIYNWQHKIREMSREFLDMDKQYSR